MFTETIEKHEMVQQRVLYAIPLNEAETRVIEMTSIFDRDTAYEHFFLRAILENTIPDKIYDNYKSDTLNFVDKKIRYHLPCRWTEVNCLQCPHYGEVSWWVFPDQKHAELSTQFSIDKNSHGKLLRIKNDENIDVVFDEQEIKARKITYQVLIPPIGGSNIINVYYVNAIVRGRWVSCELSYYNDEGTDSVLPPLLRHFMKVKNLTADPQGK